MAKKIATIGATVSGIAGTVYILQQQMNTMMILLGLVGIGLIALAGIMFYLIWKEKKESEKRFEAIMKMLARVNGR